MIEAGTTGRRVEQSGAYGRRGRISQIFSRARWGVALMTGALILVLGILGAGAAQARPLRLVALGDSLTAGYNLPQQQAFPTALQKALRAKGFDVVIVNAGVSGDTSAGLLERMDWSLSDGADGAIVEIGANDMLRGLDPQHTEQNIDAILQNLRARNIPFLIAGMRAAPNLGGPYAEAFEPLYQRLAKKYDAPLYPFFLEGVAGAPKLQLPDGLHPNDEGVKLMVENILPTIVAWLEKIEKN